MRTIHKLLFHSLFAFALVAGALDDAVLAQPYSLHLDEVSTVALPRITLKTLILDNAMPLSLFDGVTYTLSENGLPVDIRVDCPKPYNSVALVIDNTTLLKKPADLDSVKAAAIRFIEGLAPTDECLIATYDEESGSHGKIAMDATTDKNSLIDYIGNLTFVGVGVGLVDDWPVFRTISLAMDALQQRAGRKICVVITVNPKNVKYIQPYNIDKDVILATGIPIYTIGWNFIIPDGYERLIDQKLISLALASGGQYYHIPKSESPSFEPMLQAITENMNSPYCSISYQSDGCEDSLRLLELTAEIGGERVTVDTTIATPFRSDTLALTVESTQADLLPKQVVDVYFRLHPGMHQDMYFSYSFLVKFDPTALDIHTPLLTTGTMSDNDIPIFEKLRPGVYRCAIEVAYPSAATGNLIGMKFKVFDSDSSRPAIITIDSVTLTNGCPNVVISYPDTVYICNCEQPMAVEVQEALVAASEEVRVPVMLTGTPLVEKSLFTLHLNYDSDFLEPIGVDGVGAITENALLQWRIKNGDTLEVRANEEFDPAPGNVLFYVRFRVKHPKSATVSALSIPYMRAFSDCCYHQATPGPNAILIDGLCDKVVRRRADFTLEPNSPNPARGETSFRFTVYEQERFSEAQATLTLYRSDGTVVSELYSNSVRPGEYAVPYNLAALPVGTYYYTLSISGRVQTRSMVVVR